MIHTVSGMLNAADMKRVTRAARNSAVGPTAVYYAGVTAPVISAGVAFVTNSVLITAGLSEYWGLMLSSLLAAMAGISWYLIFIRLATERSIGRASDLHHAFEISIADEGLHVKRGEIDTLIGWPAIETVNRESRHALIEITGRAPVIVPYAWFSGGKGERETFLADLEKRAG